MDIYSPGETVCRSRGHLGGVSRRRRMFICKAARNIVIGKGYNIQRPVRIGIDPSLLPPPPRPNTSRCLTHDEIAAFIRLGQAIDTGNTDEIRTILDVYNLARCQFHDWTTPLVRAIRLPNRVYSLSVVKTLCEHPVHPASLTELIDSRFGNNCPNVPQTLCELAIDEDNIAVIKYMVSSAQVSATMSMSMTTTTRVPVLHRAIFNGNVEMVRILVDANINVDARDSAGCTALNYAVKCSSVDIVKLLVARMPEQINILDHTDRSPLKHAAIRGNVHLVAALLESTVAIDEKTFHLEYMVCSIEEMIRSYFQTQRQAQCQRYMTDFLESCAEKKNFENVKIKPTKSFLLHRKDQI